MADAPAAQPQIETLLPWALAEAGAEALAAEPLPTVRPMWRLRLRPRGGEAFDCVLRCERPAAFLHAAEYPVRREAAVLAALAGQGLPVPRVLAVRDAPAALLMECLPGSSDFAALVARPARRDRVALDFMRLLARLHAVDPVTSGLAEVLPVPRGPRGHALLELEAWERIYLGGVPRPEALMRLGLAWLRAHAPLCEETVLVHGDTGPNQCLHEGDAISGLLDWELAHLGDPMEDLGCLAARATMEDFGPLPALLARYAAESGRRLDPARIAYYRLFAFWKYAACTGIALATAEGEAAAAVAGWDAALREGLAACLAEAAGLPFEPALPAFLPA